MAGAEGNWVNPPMPGHGHATLWCIAEIAVPTSPAGPAGVVWARFILPDKRCPHRDCQVDLLLDLNILGGWLYRTGQPWLNACAMLLAGESWTFLPEAEYPIDDLRWAVSDGTIETARRKMVGYLEYSGGERVGDLEPDLAKMFRSFEGRLKVAS